MQTNNTAAASTPRRHPGAVSGDDARAIHPAGANAPATRRHKYHQPYPASPRPGEVVGGGFFVFRRGDGTGRVRPSMWPFEHPDHQSAFTEAQRLAAAHPGYRFDVFSVAGSHLQVPA